MPGELIRKPVHFDAVTRRLWIYGQRSHHGAWGVVLTAAGAVGLATMRKAHLAALLAAGSALMLHDWQDRSIWFERGWGNQQ